MHSTYFNRGRHDGRHDHKDITSETPEDISNWERILTSLAAGAAAGAVAKTTVT